MGFVIIEVLGEDSIDAQHIKELICPDEDQVYEPMHTTVKFVDDKQMQFIIDKYLHPKEDD